MTALLDRPPIRTWADARNAVTVALCDPLFGGDPARLDEEFRRVLESGQPPPDQVSRVGDSVVLSWRGGRTLVLGG